MQSTLSAPAPQAQQQPGAHVLRFGAYAGSRVDQAPLDYVARLRRFDQLWDTTRRQLEGYLRWVMADPGRCRLPFGKFEGLPLDEAPTSYLDWLAGWEECGPALGWLVAKELRRRSGRVLVYTDLGKPPVGVVLKLHEIEDRDGPGETRSYTPSEGLLGSGGKLPSVVTQRRPKDQAQADDELFGQEHNEPPASVAAARRDRNRVFWASVQGEPTLKADDADADRVRCFDRTLEAVDLLGSAPTLEDLGDRYAAARRLAELLSQSEGWDDGSNPLLDELDAAYLRRQEQLAAGETAFTDAERRVEPTSRSRGRAVPESARVHELVRRMRGCSSADDLEDVACYVRRHKAEFTEEALARLRGWYARFRSELAAGA